MVARHGQLLLIPAWPTYFVAIGLDIVGIFPPYGPPRAIELHPMNARTVGVETGIQNGPLASAIVVTIYTLHPRVERILLIHALYSLFVFIVSAFITLWSRRANTAEDAESVIVSALSFVGIINRHRPCRQRVVERQPVIRPKGELLVGECGQVKSIRQPSMV